MPIRIKFYLIGILLILFLVLAGCNKNEPTSIDKSEEINQAKDSIKLQMENENFIFRSFDKDKECIEELAKVLDNNYSTITKNLNVTLNDKVEIVIYPTIEEFHNAIGMPDATDWVVGCCPYENKISMVSPLNPGKKHTYNSLMQVIVHEFTHAVQFNINPCFYYTKWLSEGLATYEAKQVPNKSFIKDKVDANEIPTLSEMNSNNFAEVDGYAFSYTIIEYLIKEYGYETIVSLIKSPENIEGILGKSLDEFENEWKDYLKENWGSVE